MYRIKSVHRSVYKHDDGLMGDFFFFFCVEARKRDDIFVVFVFYLFIFFFKELERNSRE